MKLHAKILTNVEEVDFLKQMWLFCCLFHSVLRLLGQIASFDFVKASVYLIWR